MNQTEKINEVFHAAQEGDVERLKELLSSEPTLANTENSDGLLPLGFAAHFGHKDAVLALLDFGADVNVLSHSKISFIPSNTALHAAIAGNRNTEVVELLLKSRANPNVIDSNGQTPLHSATFHGDKEITLLLLANGANISAKEGEAPTVLQMAIEKGHNELAELLRHHGATI